MATFPFPVPATPKMERKPVCPTCGLPAPERGFVAAGNVFDFCTNPFHKKPAARLEVVESPRA